MNIALPSRPFRPWLSHPRETIAAGALGFAALLALSGVGGAMPLLPEYATQAEPKAAVADAPPATSATNLRPLAPDAAVAVNAQMPINGTAGPAARPFSLGNASADTRARALECMTSALYYEAGQESDEGQKAVAQVILNRVRHPAFPNSVCGVIYEGSTRVTGCQFTFTCDGSMARTPMREEWLRAQRNAAAMLNGAVYAPVGHATHYHANYVVPYWASSLVKTDVEGAHIFYRWAGGWGQPGAFGDQWAGREANPASLRLAALNAPHFVAPISTKGGTEAQAVAQLKDHGILVTEKKGGRVQVHFTPEARAAVEKVKVTPYVERVSASSNLRYALDGGAPTEPQQAWGTSASAGSSSPAIAQAK